MVGEAGRTQQSGIEVGDWSNQYDRTVGLVPIPQPLRIYPSEREFKTKWA
jgi:hypothetical protein